jgi:hypothetical protein
VEEQEGVFVPVWVFMHVGVNLRGGFGRGWRGMEDWVAGNSYYVLIPSLYNSFAVPFYLASSALTVRDLDEHEGLLLSLV